ncbi:MAG TPA: tetratricopeptide repeat protein [Phycisphaerae bacterium]|nr:tetratricopeptide repeat protein [Phycisphaerae bacterium]HOB74198.1 tetratricopeptide repeat protein [Phycisphaerae bacterium]HOJ54986.1 tetratricopeptide repeat protein [Phycisphaerae bacterium]HOL26993.1 tetratricopeptide repeat protein [Phycisphaerae bacterium]HPP21422.1 tetratricopeptide repeat protein [Phycisphaerae bacterium]
MPAQPGIFQQLAGRWQVPLLLVSLAAVVAGVWRLRPEPQPAAFEPLFEHAVALHRAGLYTEASSYIDKLLIEPGRTESEKRKLFGLLARVVFDHEHGNLVHGPTNAARIIEYSNKSLAPGKSHDAATLKMRGLAWEWQRKAAQAVAEYQAAIELGAPDSWSLRKRVIEIRRHLGELDDDKLKAECEAFLAQGADGGQEGGPDAGSSGTAVERNGGARVDDKLAWWAAEQIVEVLARQKKYEEAERLLATHAERFRNSTEKGAYDYLQALIWFHMGRRADSERLLRNIRDQSEPADPVFARAGLLLGRMLLDQQAPEYALSFFEDVLAQTPPGPDRWAAVLGRAEALDAMQRYREALEGYGQAIRHASESPYESVMDMFLAADAALDAVPGLAPGWRLSRAAAYLRVVRRRAELTLKLGEAALAEANRAGLADDAPERAEAKAILAQAAEHHLGLASLVMLDEEGAVAATLKAVEAFELAGDRVRTAEVLESFIHDRPNHTAVPEALLRLGRTYQAMGEYEKAIARYQENLINYPRTPSAIASLVPLADCFVETGEPEKAEQTLLRLVEHVPGDPLGLVTPEAAQFRDALFKLAELYTRSKQYEKAIARYEEAIRRYPEDPRVGRATFRLADAYRHSAERIRSEFKESRSLPYLTELSKSYRQRLERARQLYGQVIERLSGRPVEELEELDRLQLKLSYLYAADAVFESAELADAPTLQPAAEALEMYEQAAWACAQDPIAMSAHVQIVNCLLRMGRVEKARLALQRARWALRNIPDEAFPAKPREDRAFWEEYLTWLEKTPTFASTQPAEG